MTTGAGGVMPPAASQCLSGPHRPVQTTLIVGQIINGLLVGAIYLLIALGLSLIFSLGGIVNLAHGAFYAIGAYLAVVLTPRIGFGGSLVASPVLVGLLGLVIERLLFRRFYRSDPIRSCRCFSPSV